MRIINSTNNAPFPDRMIILLQRAGTCQEFRLKKLLLIFPVYTLVVYYISCHLYRGKAIVIGKYCDNAIKVQEI